MRTAAVLAVSACLLAVTSGLTYAHAPRRDIAASDPPRTGGAPAAVSDHLACDARTAGSGEAPPKGALGLGRRVARSAGCCRSRLRAGSSPPTRQRGGPLPACGAPGVQQRRSLSRPTRARGADLRERAPQATRPHRGDVRRAPWRARPDSGRSHHTLAHAPGLRTRQASRARAAARRVLPSGHEEPPRGRDAPFLVHARPCAARLRSTGRSQSCAPQVSCSTSTATTTAIGAHPLARLRAPTSSSRGAVRGRRVASAGSCRGHRRGPI